MNLSCCQKSTGVFLLVYLVLRKCLFLMATYGVMSRNTDNGQPIISCVEANFITAYWILSEWIDSVYFSLSYQSRGWGLNIKAAYKQFCLRLHSLKVLAFGCGFLNEYYSVKIRFIILFCTTKAVASIHK